jgi:imidazolonepropionase-like amidohydrolase
MTDHPSRYALTGATLIDGSGKPPAQQMAVLVDGQSIVKVGAVGTIALAQDVPVYDLAGKTLMPGLIDGHVHLLSFAGEGYRDIHLWNVLTFLEEQTIHAAGNAVKALRAGVTTVRDMAGSRPEISAGHAMRDFVLPGARIVVAGFVGMTAGHGDMFVPACIDRRMWHTADGPDECRKLVRAYARDGADLIKICTSGGVLSLGDEVGWRNYTLDEVRAIVDEAHALGKKVAAHAHTRAAILQALEAGVDTLEHGSDLDPALVERMVKQGTWLCPTLAITEFVITRGAVRGIPRAAIEKGEPIRRRRTESMVMAYRAGVKIFMGTDSCNTMPFGSHAWELELMQRDIGMSPMEAIVASTSSAAGALGLGDKTGTIEPGKWADLLVVDGDPLADLRILQDQARLLAVFRDGRLLINRGLVIRSSVATGKR